ncbi:glucosamine inositolphosphorylceramide transferase family protein [Neobacillus vireti]|uniref:glucosamine inositolphosphorylceramide transferase family protein n=1 Tax=Neobacillus vireti TaxID=220686 RepID=UPI003B587FD0
MNLRILKKEIDLAEWSIKVFNSNLIYSKKPDDKIFNDPSIKAEDVTDVPAEFVADPFLTFYKSRFYLFFEVLNMRSELGEIGLATSEDGEKWTYQKIVLKERYHLSYPHVFEFEDQFYMVPESSEAKEVILYKAKNFPYEWEKYSVIANGKYIDPTIFQYNSKWWMFVGTPNGDLHLFYSEKIEGKWIKHSLSPIIKDNYNISRPAGRVIIDNNKIYRFTQDCKPYYGKQVRSFIINKLTENEYQEEEINIILNGSDKNNDWRRDGMHHIDQLKINGNEWLIAVDGHKFKTHNYLKWKIKSIYRAPVANINRLLNNLNLLREPYLNFGILMLHQLTY